MSLRGTRLKVPDNEFHDRDGHNEFVSVLSIVNAILLLQYNIATGTYYSSSRVTSAHMNEVCGIVRNRDVSRPIAIAEPLS